MALRTQPVALRPQIEAMRLVAVRAGYPGAEHPALQERAVFEHLTVDLAVSVVKARFQIGGSIGIEQRRAGYGILRNHPASRVAGATGIDFRRRKRL